MQVELKKFGTLLNSRPSGKKNFSAFQSTLAELKADESLEINFDGVITFSPSWGDEFLTPLLTQLDERLILLPTDNPSVKITVEILERTQPKKFRFVA
jgi:hypothetical protein